MGKGFFITGTDTDIGKTRSALALMVALQQRGLNVCGMKPVSAGCQVTNTGLVNEDALLLQQHASKELPYAVVNPYAWGSAIAPHIAAQRAASEMTLAPIRSAYQTIAAQCDVVIVEGAGGWLVPLNATQTMADIALELTLPVILVVGVRLGCLNHALLSMESIKNKGCRMAGWIANYLSESSEVTQQNVEYLVEKIEAPLLGCFPFQKEASIVELAINLNNNFFNLKII